ncbi:MULTISPECIES: cadmium resistance transporter [Fructobacillus]|jgi:cadmium resistance transport/sequestration family protein|uniref:Predicted permease (CadD) n=1 Tax=Fructobacillus cardui TaxID=2893170 RepID=A0ABN9YY08_9LACO|nr:cadmium resistance transporter [Fructobacillus sp. EFB-N1]KMK53815.1 Cadmium resistance transporter [Fructobacillus sp. EFB-N1]CAK1221990.1 Cadmium resistance protein CadD [Fructobacillus cardui]CAK1244201.1 Cadmium resistance protein CadD [Fructobacillus cardui]CAK1252422.1 Cadmium resistance protein CadD [Fructobacillus cardui]
MTATLITGFFSYLGTTSDYFVILVLLFATFRKKSQVRPIILGAYLGNALLVGAALLIGGVLKQIPAEWILGLLGLVPVAIGVKNYFSNEEEEEGEAFITKVQETPNQRIVLTVILMTIAGCGADNLALYIPYFSLANWAALPIIFLMFTAILTICIFSAYRLAKVQKVQDLFERYGDLMQLLVYVALGIYILFDAGTVTHLLSLL